MQLQNKFGMNLKEIIEKVVNNIIDEFINIWHKSDSKLELHEFLGLTWEEYAMLVENQNKFIQIIFKK